MSTGPGLARRLGTTDAVVIGLGSMIGAGVFSAFAPAAQAAGAGLLIGLIVAAMVAYCNATVSAQLAASYPTSGGTYVYGRERLGNWWGFVVGKTASCAAMALTFAAYAVPQAWQRPVAIAAVFALAAVNYRGVTRTARLTRIIIAVVLVALAVVVTASPDRRPARRDRVLLLRVLLYYLIANLSAFTQPADQRRFPRWLQVLGADGCVLLLATLPWPSVLTGVGAFAVGVAYRAWRFHRAARSN